MTLFKQICKRSTRALYDICEFTANQQSPMKIEDSHDVLYDGSTDITEIKVRSTELKHPYRDQNILFLAK